MTIPEAPAIESKSFALIDFDSGELLAGNNPDARVEPASITKVLTTYVAFDEIRKGRLKLDDTALISEKAWRQGKDSSESRMFLSLGSRVKIEDILRGMSEALQGWSKAPKPKQWDALASLKGTAPDLLRGFSLVFGSPIAAYIMDSFGGVAGLKSWQWLFIIEGLPSILLGFITLKAVIDRPADAKWLTDAEKAEFAAAMQVVWFC